jgi:YVTN family beta-propeller protein
MFRRLHLPSGAAALIAAAALLAACSDAPPTGTGGEQQLGALFDAKSLRLKQGSTLRLSSRVRAGAAEAPVTFSVVNAGSLQLQGEVATGSGPGAAVVVGRSGDKVDTLIVDVVGHPGDAKLAARRPLSARPFGAAISRGGVVYITRLDAEALAVADADKLTLAAEGIRVGYVPTSVTFDTTGTVAYVANQYSQSIGVVDVRAGVQVAEIPIDGDPFNVYVSWDNSKVYAANNQNSVFVIDRAKARIAEEIEVGSAPNGFAPHPAGGVVYVSSFVGGTVAEVDAATDAVRRSLALGGMPQGMIMSSEGKELYVANESGWLDVIDVAQWRSVARVPLAGGGFGLALSPDEAHLYVSLPNAGRVQIVNIPSRHVIKTLETGGTPRRIAFNYHGGIAVVPNEAGWVDFIK